MRKGVCAGRSSCAVRALFGALSVGVAILFAAPSFAQVAFPLKVGSDQRHLVDQNDVPFLINGESAWELIRAISDSDVNTYLDNRQAKGFNTVLVMLIEHYYGPDNYYGDGPFTTPNDFSTPNEAYFAHADSVIAKAAARDMLVLLAPAYLGYACNGTEGWSDIMQSNGTAKLQGYGTYLGNRYKQFSNIIWVDGGDCAATGTDLANVQTIANAITAADPTALHTAHSNRQNSALDSYNYSWLDVNSTYSDCSQAAAKTQTDYNRSRVMPFFFIEGTYENEGASSVCLRSQAYWSVLGGSTGNIFGNNPVFWFGSGWKSALASAGATSMSHMGALFNSRPWSKLAPDYSHRLITAGYGTVGSTSYLGAALASDGSTGIAYMPTSRTVTADLTRISGTQVNAWWYQPSSGTATLIGAYANTGSRDFTPGSSGDWVLVLDDASRNFPAPGSEGGTAPKVPSPPTNIMVR